MSEERTEYHAKMAKARPEEIDKLRQFFQDLEEKIDDPYREDRSIGEWVRDNLPEWERTVYGYTVMFEHACDPTLSYLEFKPEIKAAMEAYEREKAGLATTQWQKYRPDDLFGPGLGEGCLWTIEIKGKRNYFYGYLARLFSEAPIRLVWQGGGRYELNDTVYWARIIHLEVPDEKQAAGG